MANNRMWLVNEETNQRVFIGKYYPPTGWYIKDPENLAERIDEAFQQSDFGMTFEEAKKKGVAVKDGLWGDTNWKIVYETVEGITNDPVVAAKINIVESIQSITKNKEK